MSSSLRVLNLITNPDARCYAQQRDALESLGVETVTMAPTGSHDVTGDVERGRSALDYARFLPAVLREARGQYDLLHGNYGLTGPAAVLQPSLPTVLSLWGSDLFGRYGWLTKRCARRADAVIVMSQAMADELDRPCYVIPHGVDLDRFTPRSRAVALAELDWDPAHHHVLFPYPPVRDVKDYPRAQRVVRAAGDQLDRAVELHPVVGVPHRRMPTYMNAADVLLMTSRHEGSPNTVKEAMACNLPVVSTDVGDVAERVAGVTPSAVGRTDRELIDALVDILWRGERSDGRESVTDLTTERTGERVLDVYRAVLGEIGDRPARHAPPLADGPGSRPAR